MAHYLTPSAFRIRNTFSATRDPIATDDSSKRYAVGSRWLNTTTLTLFVCLDASIGAAIWKEITGGLVKQITLYVVEFSTALSTGDGQVYWRVPTEVGGLNLSYVEAQLGNAQSTSGTPTFQIARLRFTTAGGARAAVDMLSTAITIDANEWDSKDAAIPNVIDTANDDVLEGDLIRVDVDVAGTGTQGLFMSLGFS